MDPHARDASREGFPVDPISIPKQIRGSRIIRERLDELLGCPDCRGMVGDVEMEVSLPFNPSRCSEDRLRPFVRSTGLGSERTPRVDPRVPCGVSDARRKKTEANR